MIEDVTLLGELGVILLPKVICAAALNHAMLDYSSFDNFRPQRRVLVLGTTPGYPRPSEW